MVTTKMRAALVESTTMTSVAIIGSITFTLTLNKNDVNGGLWDQNLAFNNDKYQQLKRHVIEWTFK